MECAETRECRNSRTNRYWPWCKVFLVSLLACVITTSIGVLILALVYVDNFRPYKHHGATDSPSGGVSSPQTCINDEPTFQFHFPLNKSKEYVFQGGSIQCASYRKNASTYSSPEEMAFGQTLNYFQSKISVCTLVIKSGGLRVPNWNLNANVHALIKEGIVWVGVVDAGSTSAVTYNATVGEVIFIPQNRLYWIKNPGNTTSTIVIFFSSQGGPFSLEANDVFFSTPEDILARALVGVGGIVCIRSIVRPSGDNVIILPPNLAQLIQNATYPQSADALVWKYFYSLKGARLLSYQGGLSQWARCYSNTTTLSKKAVTFSDSLLSHADTLGLQVLRLNSSALLTPHSNVNANGMAYVIAGCGKVGIAGQATQEFDIVPGDVVFFPIGKSYYINSTCDKDLILALAYSTCGKLETLYMDDYIYAIRGTILSQLIGKNGTCLDNMENPNYNVTISDPAANPLFVATFSDDNITATEETTEHIAITKTSDTEHEVAIILDPEQ